MISTVDHPLNSPSLNIGWNPRFGTDIGPAGAGVGQVRRCLGLIREGVNSWPEGFNSWPEMVSSWQAGTAESAETNGGGRKGGGDCKPIIRFVKKLGLL
jgi:hypothetical protein